MPFATRPSVGSPIIDNPCKYVGVIVSVSDEHVRFSYWCIDKPKPHSPRVVKLPTKMFIRSGWSLDTSSGKRPLQREYALCKYGICADCLSPLVFDADEPFAYCHCGTREWGDDRPVFAVVPTAVVNALPRTRDGEILYPGMRVYDASGGVWYVKAIGTLRHVLFARASDTPQPDERVNIPVWANLTGSSEVATVTQSETVSKPPTEPTDANRD